ncbi:hypothetical protein JAO29_10100 [Edaphobacter sp. HDX4]|uniref:hypothetical protein n=1 Tax=Edaphobacter sp. HDX4 TaxID=2794064 RepID=UPI002FE637A1
MSAHVTSQPTLTVDSDLPETGLVGVTVRGLDPDLMVSLGKRTLTNGLLKSLLGVSVVRTGASSGDDLPNIFGRYQILEDCLRFIPHFPFERGLSYRASFDPRPLGRPEFSEVLTLEFSLPKALSAAPAEVQHIFPSSDDLPENLLRFYVGFSNPMQRGQAEAEIRLLGPDGEPATDVLYRAPVELWDRSMRCLTILLDPGRLKRKVGPNRELGPPLKAGQVYTLAVGAGMLDFDGRPLTATVNKRFVITEAVREHIAVEQWKIVSPVSQSREPLVLLFPQPLDWALLGHAIAIASTDGQSINGRIVIDQGEKRWSFTPTSPWAAGSYHVRVASSLEDVCGNNILAPFDRPLRSGSDLPFEVTTRSIAFHINPVSGAANFS